jgi:hypothetical protein
VNGNGTHEQKPETIDGVTLEEHAVICAEIAEGDRDVKDVLEAHGLSQQRWADVSLAWMQRLADDVKANREHARLPMIYSDAFGRAQNARKPVPALSVEGWAELTVEIMRKGSPGPALVARGLSQADYLRLARHWARVLSSDPVASKRFDVAFAALQRPTETK